MSTYSVYNRQEAQQAMDDRSPPAQTVMQELWWAQQYQTVEELMAYGNLRADEVQKALDELEGIGMVRSGSNAADANARIYYLNVEEVLYAED